MHNSVLFYPDVTTGCSRFDTPAEYAALIEVYRCLCPLYNYWYPSFKLVSKEKQADGRYKKVYGKEARTPFQRLWNPLIFHRRARLN